MITIEDLLKGRDITHKNEYNEEIKKNLLVLANKVNELLVELGIENATVSSGWRPPSVNGTIVGAAKKSQHMLGCAVDLNDKDYTIWNKVAERPDLLKKYGLWLEHKDATPKWVHLDMSTSRKDREIRIFKA